MEDHVAFITLSFTIRIVEAMGNAAFLTASFAIIAKEFPNNVATMFVSKILAACYIDYLYFRNGSKHMTVIVYWLKMIYLIKNKKEYVTIIIIIN